MEADEQGQTGVAAKDGKTGGKAGGKGNDRAGNASASGDNARPQAAKPAAKPRKRAPRPKAAKTQAGARQPGLLRRFFAWVRSNRFARRASMVLGGLLLLPVVLTLLYAVPFVRPVSTLMLADLVRFQGYAREWRSLDEISDVLKHSVIMSEDGQFCSHHGVDLGELKGVVQDALEGESPRGASTLTMQLAKNLFLWPSRSYVRKVLELPLAVMMDLILSKRRILEIYLNIAEWGPDNVYGIEAASRLRFKTGADALTRRQAALLAVSLPNPVERNAAKPSSGMTRVARVVERRARASGAYVACVE